MQWFLALALVFSLLLLVVGWQKSVVQQVKKQRCYACGWTAERVRACELMQDEEQVIVQMCFECCVKYEAMPYISSNTHFSASA